MNLVYRPLYCPCTIYILGSPFLLLIANFDLKMDFNKELSIWFFSPSYIGSLGQLDGKFLQFKLMFSHTECFVLNVFTFLSRQGILILSFLSSVCGQTGLNTKIIGGQNATEGSWPWQASIFSVSFGLNFCSGSLINKEWVLSAAQCFIGYGVPKLILIRFLWISSVQVSYSLDSCGFMIVYLLYLQHPSIWPCGVLGTSDPKWFKPTRDKQDSD